MKFVIWDYVYIPEEKQMMGLDGKSFFTRNIRFISLNNDGIFCDGENHPSGYKITLIKESDYTWQILRINFRKQQVIDGFLFLYEDRDKTYFGSPKFLIENDFDWHKMQLAKPFEHFDAKINAVCARLKKRGDDAVKRIQSIR